MRLDVCLFEKKLARSRNDAKNMITSGNVSVNGKPVLKPAYDVIDTDEITVDDATVKYVSRGGFKLECAITNFDFDIEGRLAIDIGASTGGFTDCLLKNGAKHVIAIDSGSAQLVESLKQDGRVTSIENYNARYIKREDLPYTPTLAVMDVSFISATYIIEGLYNCLADSADFICLIKPQFEVGRNNVGKGGIVKDEKIRYTAVERVCSFAETVGFKNVAVVESSVVGSDGNIEFLAHFKKEKLN